MTVPPRPALALVLLLAGCARATTHETTATDATPAGSTDRGATADAPGADAGSATNAAGATIVTGTEMPGSEAPPGTAADAGGDDAGGATTTGDAGAAWARGLAPLLFRDVNTLADVTMRLYKDDGSVDDAAAAEVERVLWAAKDEAPPHVSRRLLQLVVKVAEHFGAHEIQVISSHRGKASKRSRHRTGEAIDIVIPSVPVKKLAEELRTYARVGVGVYVHPKSQFVHLDVREQSYHWIDGSPPRRSWREQPLLDPTAAARDAAYTPSQDLPESAKP